MGGLSDAQKKCAHEFSFRHEIIDTGKRVFECWKCGAWKDGRAREGTMSWKAQKMIAATGAKVVTMGDAVKWFDENFPDDKYATKSSDPQATSATT